MALEAELLPSEQEELDRRPTDSTQAYNAYLRSFIPGRADALILEYLNQAIEFDPEFALAFARKALYYAESLTLNTELQEEDLPRLEALAQENAEKALELDANVGYAYTALARIHWAHWREADARAALDRALQLSPNDSDILNFYANFTLHTSGTDESIRLARRAVELDPNNADSHFSLGQSHFFARNPMAAATAFLKSIELAPTSMRGHMQLGLVESMRGDNNEAFEELALAEQLGGDETPSAASRIAYGYAQIGRQDDAIRLLGVLDEMATAGQRVGPAQWGIAHLAAGNYQESLRWLNIAIDNRDNSFRRVNNYGAVEGQCPLRPHPRPTGVRRSAQQAGV